MPRLSLLLLPPLLALSCLAFAAPPPHPAVPGPLVPWQEWVLESDGTWRCTPATESAVQRHCLWPGPLELRIDRDRGARFSQRWRLEERSAVPLPGGEGLWPAVRLEGRPLPVVERNGRPVVWLEPGEYLLEGEIVWSGMPSRLPVPRLVALVSLRVDGEPRQAGERDDDGSVWLERPAAGEADGRPPDETLHLRVHRRLEDRIPVLLETVIQIQASGRPREATLQVPLPEGFTPFRLRADLPARLRGMDTLRLQLRPGSWTITLWARSSGAVEKVRLPAASRPWPPDEIWALDTGHYRDSELRGLRPVDPGQTEPPAAWGSLRLWRVPVSGEGATRFELVQLQRLPPDRQPDDLSLARQVWLDFDGGGYTFEDHLRGTLRRSWRLTASPEIALGRVTVEERDRLVTRLPGEEGAGVELRHGSLRLRATSRYEGERGSLPANGWNTPFQRVTALLHLPPGWRLVAVGGVEPVAGSWLERWSLLDLFLVLIAAIATARLFGLPPGALALLALTLGWHEPWFPSFAWLNLLAATALFRELGGGRLATAVRVYRHLSVALLLLALLPFLFHSVRTAVFPQLDSSAAAHAVRSPPSAPPPPERAGPEEPGERAKAADAVPLAPQPVRPDLLALEDPDAAVQTGPATPQWSWNRVSLRWNGPVNPDERIRLWLISPPANSLLKLLSAALAALLALRLAGFSWPPSLPWRGRLPGMLILILFSLPPPPAVAGDFPSAELLEELRHRLSRPPECLPGCATLPSGAVAVEAGRVRLVLDVHAETSLALPLPSARGWEPLRVVLEGENASFLLRDAAGVRRLLVPAGISRVRMEGPLTGGGTSLDLQFPLPLQQLSVEAPGWRHDPLTPLRAVRTLSLERTADREGEFGREGSGDRPATLPALVEVRRELHLGLQWRVETILSRRGEGAAPVRLAIPLLEGEQPLDEGVTVEEGRMELILPAGRREIRLLSRLPLSDTLRLTAPGSLPPGGDGWYQVWTVRAAPLWHVSHRGLPLTGLFDSSGGWRLEWLPWPGETVTLQVSRPQGVPGPTLTIDSIRLESRPGRLATDQRVRVSLRASRGDVWTPRLPEGARIGELRLDGRPLAHPADGGYLKVPLDPGSHEVEIGWQEAGAAGAVWHTPFFDAGLPLANIRMSAMLGEGRWTLLTGGPVMGPAVLFWGMVLVLLVLAWGLARTRLTPLGTLQWFLLGIGLSQIPLTSGLVVAGWLLLLGLRARHQPMRDDWFNAFQVVIVACTLLALPLLFDAIRQGLLGRPEMQIAGLGSSGQELHWYQDRAGPRLPEAWSLSLPLLYYRLAMLAWALWLAFALLRWLAWGWKAFGRNGFWRGRGEG